ncbi:hypothetical protein [Polynucleobacter sp. UB-Piko-W3]|uniref:hypothetical protein n=1 Tax=Polynucleobacter sp. UB-Piko-W3 TaxID=1819735 RepID=UPI001C0C66D8|nr:hypothetical protein [Polynucleobacter sp. UB-Piko-W3]MBU3554984.1 hypothetical protein [Polynucleobacter sp. UB-Piko-W3]
MAIPIPPNLPINPVVDFHRNDLVSPPAAPTVVESLAAIDPRIALKMPLPVVDSSAGGSLQDVLQSAVGRGQPSTLLPTEPTVDQAVLLQISSFAGDQAEATGNPSQARVDSLLSQSLNRMDALGGAALGQMLSDILAVDVPELGQAVNTGNKNTLQNVVVNWPGANPANTNAALANTTDPRVAMNVLYQNLQTSGIFAADQLKKLLFPASDDGDMQSKVIRDIPAEAERLVGQLSSSPALQDSVKLLLRGDLLWQGQLMPNVQGRLYREDAWQSDPQDPTQMQKGSKITMEITLPNLGPFKVVGTQFGESVYVAIEASPDSQTTLANAFAQLLGQMHSQIDPDAKVSLKGEASS